MPFIVDQLLMSSNPSNAEQAKTFWDNATAYAQQSAAYGAERMQMLDKMGAEIYNMLSMVPPEIQSKVSERLTDALIRPVEHNTAQEFDSAWARLQVVTQELHKKLTPALSRMSMMGMAGAAPSAPMAAPQGAMY